MLKRFKITRYQNKHRKRVNKNIRHSKKKTRKLLDLQEGGGSKNSNKEKFQLTTFRSLNEDDLNRFKISNYVNANIDWGTILPGPPPTDCVIQ